MATIKGPTPPQPGSKNAKKKKGKAEHLAKAEAESSPKASSVPSNGDASAASPATGATTNGVNPGHENPYMRELYKYGLPYRDSRCQTDHELISPFC